MDLLQKLIQNLEKGRESAHQMRGLLQELLLSSDDDQEHDHYKGFDAHSMVVLTSLDNALSLLQSCDNSLVEDFTRPAKIARMDENHSPSQPCKSEESGAGSPKSTATTINKEKRGCYKRRRSGQSKILDISTLTDDGFAWRKYGQKIILNTKHPRNYYRCTHKHDQGCLATKQVQQVSDNPTKYRVIYQGDHTCKNFNKNSQYVLEPEEQQSSIFLNFATNSTTAKLNHFSFSSSTATIPSEIVKQEYTPIKEEIPSAPHDPHHGVYINQQYSSSSEYNSSDLTTTGVSSTPVSSDQGDVFSSAEVYSSLASPLGMEEDYRYIMADSSDYCQVLDLLCAGSC